MKDYGKALADANAALALYPQSPSVNAYLERAGAFRRKGDMPAALDDLKTACRLGNGNACQFYERAAVRP
jgi:tetratricopeptide (TPR) repeat protein